jgi:hypothetical protein
MLRHLATEIGDQWRDLVLGLGVPRVKIESIIRNNANNDDVDAILEMLTSWVKRLPRAADKVGETMQTVGLLYINATGHYS